MRTALAVAVMLLFGLVAAQAFFGQQFCAAQLQLPRSEMKQQGLSAIEVLIPGGRSLYEKMNRDQYVQCMCPKGDQPCDCCEYDIAKVCAEVKRIEAATLNRLRLAPCEEGQR